MPSSRVLVTGSAGFIGSHLLERLLQKDNTVIAIDNFSEGQARNIENIEMDDDIQFIQGDITKPGALEAIVNGCDVIYHLANSRGNRNQPEVDLAVNIQGTFRLLEAARKSEKQPAIIYPSTNKVYGRKVNRITRQERETRLEWTEKKFKYGIPANFPLEQKHLDQYGLTKLIADLYVQTYAHLYGLNTGVFRQSTIYGPRDTNGWIYQILRRAVSGEPVHLHGEGKQVRDILFVDDLIDAYLAFGETTRSSGLWNIGGGPDLSISVRELITLAEDHLDQSIPVDRRSAREQDQKIFVSDIRPLKQDLGWEPEVPPRKGISQVFEWLKNTL